MRPPQLWIIAGPNGSGKSSLVLKYADRFKDLVPVINPDVIAKKMNPDDVSKVAIKAGMEAIRRQNRFLKERVSFGIETTFSGKREPKLLSLAKDAGYR